MSYDFTVFIIRLTYDSSIASALTVLWIRRMERCVKFYCEHVFVFQTEFEFRMRGVKILESHWQFTESPFLLSL